MGHGEKDLTQADIELGYERNEIQLKGVIYFGVGLFLLIVITFGLMYILWGVMEQRSAEEHAVRNPMQLSERDRLPPEPRLQSAPGFGVDSPNGRVNLELAVPQAEYWELKKQWDDLRKNGRKDSETGIVIAMPIDQAKEEFLSQGVKSRTGEEAVKNAERSKRYLTDASSGRMATAERK
ncbi:MAG: hypothetical protein KF685_04930 [Acidobacteria bacterium]|nr:hypothetical protein [Acidobacteriota bacterium]